jgi:hypothetical protein
MKGRPLTRAESPLHEEKAVFEQLTDLGLDPLLPPRSPPGRLGGTTPGKLGGTGRQAPPLLGHRREDRLGQFPEDVESADLMGHIAEDGEDRLGIEVRAVGGDSADGQPSGLQGPLEPAEERLDIGLGGIVVEDLVGQAFEGAIVDDRQDAEGSVIQLVGGDEAREIG